MLEGVLDVAVIGAGPAGVTAGIYAGGVYKLKTAVFGRDFGMAGMAHEYLNFPSYKSISGTEIVKKMREHLKEGFGQGIVNTEIVSLKKNNELFELIDKDGKKYLSKTLVLAIGLVKRKVEIVGEFKFFGKGVSYCAACDAIMFNGKTVAMVGGSDSCAQNALLLAKHAEKVFVFYRGKEMHCQPIYLEKINKTPNIEILYNTVVKELFGKTFLEEALIEQDGVERKVRIDGVFIEAGSIPSIALLKNLGLNTSSEGFVIVDSEQLTNVQGVFAAGDITAMHKGFKQAIVACSEGALAGHSAFTFLKGKKDS